MHRQLRVANSSTTGLVYLGVSCTHARSLKQSPCRLDEKSDGRTAPQYEHLYNGRANVMHRREEVLGMPLWGKCTKSRILIYHRYAHNPSASCFRSERSNDHNLLKNCQLSLKCIPLDPPFQCASNTPTLGFKHRQIFVW
jgi:hypothetical protein